MSRYPRPDALFFLIGCWFSLLFVVSLVWLLLVMLSNHGTSDTFTFLSLLFGPTAVSIAVGLAAFVAWLRRRRHLATSVVLISMVSVLCGLLYWIGQTT